MRVDGQCSDELSIEGATGEEVVVGSCVSYMTVFEDDDLVDAEHLDRRCAMVMAMLSCQAVEPDAGGSGSDPIRSG